MSKYTATVFVPAKSVGYGAARRMLPPLEVTVELTLDVEGIATLLGRKAARSTGKRSADIGGLAVVRVLKSKELAS